MKDMCVSTQAIKKAQTISAECISEILMAVDFLNKRIDYFSASFSGPNYDHVRRTVLEQKSNLRNLGEIVKEANSRLSKLTKYIDEYNGCKYSG